jgi:hypothetical protein
MIHNRRLENVDQNNWQIGTLRMKEWLVIYEPQIAFQPNYIYLLHSCSIFINEQVLKVKDRSPLFKMFNAHLRAITPPQLEA